MSVAPLTLGAASHIDASGYAKALAAAKAAVFSWHVDSSKVNFSDEFYSLTGLDVARLTRITDFLDLLPPDSQKHFVEQVGRATARRRTFDCTVTLRLPQGARPCRIVGAIQGGFAQIGEVTGIIQLQAADDADRHSETGETAAPEQAGRMLDALQVGVWYFQCDGTLQYANRQAEQWLPDRAAYTTRAQLMDHWDEPDQRRRELKDVLQTGEAVYANRETATLAGDERHIAVDKIPMRNAAGAIDGLMLVVSDVTESASREAALWEARARYQAFIAGSTDVIWCYEIDPPVDISAPLEEQVDAIDSRALLTECNDYFAQRYGVENAEALLGSSLRHADIPRYRVHLQQFIKNGYQLIDQEMERRTKTRETEYWQLTTIGTVKDGKLLRLWGTSKDITERHRYLEQLRYQATHDSLTQLPNRTRLYREIENAIKNLRENQHMALLIIDLDRFKEINDTLGHQAGDKVLRQLGPRLEGALNGLRGLIARLGGDEFALFLPDILTVQQAILVGQQVLDALQRPFVIEGFHTEIGASVGISTCPDQATDVSTLMRYADVAMYRAKQDMIGVTLYHADQDPHSPKRLALMGELGRAIREDQLLLQFQPKVALQTNTVAGCEALVCWHHPRLGFITPGEFVPIAECSGVIHPLTQWVLEHSLDQARAWQRQGLNIPVSVNLSARNLMDSRIALMISDLLQQYGVPPSLLELEITESAIMEDPARALDVLGQIHALGVRLAIDDFGTGYSSLAYIKRLPVQTLKIDSTFVVNMLDDEQDRIIVNSTINLAHNLGLTVVAEGVETEAALAALAEMGCDYAQGYHLLRPGHPEAVESWLAQRRSA